MTEPIYMCSLCGENTTPDPTGLVKAWVVGAHLLPFVVVVFGMWCIMERLEILKKRIYSPFLLITGFVYCAIASMPEVASHIFAMNWNACYDSVASDSILLFYIFLSLGFSSITIALRPKGLRLIRCPRDFWDLVNFICDIAIIVLSVGIGPIYFITGKGFVVTLFIIVQSISSIIGIFRINSQLGPSKKMFFLGAISELSASVIAIPLNLYIQKSGNQVLHGFLACAFVLNQFGIAICIFNVMDPDPSDRGIELSGEKRPLNGGAGSFRAKYETVAEGP